MNFISILYGIFLLVVLAFYWSVAKQRLRLWILLIASIAFYATLQLQYIPLLLVLIFINFRIGIAIGQNQLPEQHSLNEDITDEESRFAQADWNSKSVKLLYLGVSINILLLLGFKYLSPLLNFIGNNNSTNLPFAYSKIIAPLGISFFVFECIAYLVDVYRGAPATYQFIKFAAYKFFFAKLISGPITRFHNLANQFSNLRSLTAENLSEALWLIAIGAAKKGLIADHIGIYVDLCFGNLQRASSADLWLATFAYGFQLYLDFSGYVDIARGTALLFGLVLPENFDFPYFSTSIAEFWRRWHMTLGDWLRNYLYFPLGGSRKGLDRTCLNLMIVMIIAGIWHGAALGFLVWGAYHGLALVVHRLTDALSDSFEELESFWQQPLGIFISWLLTQLMVFTSWIWFRLPNLQDSSLVFQRLWGYRGDAQFAQKVYVEALNISQYQLTILLLSLTTFMTVVYFFNRQLKLQLNWYIKLLFVIPCFYAVWVLAPEGSLPYIYFDF
ncbi:MBOAT family protein [Chlorogloeopsis sp. ULAP02]|uniref:MBOAT family O-acyltransferase n=1 Tax=Chlorogloeopsis sp. ULAP02 TaxID=3107926 RepID=UPI003134B4F8